MLVIPRDNSVDASLSLLFEGNTFITRRCEKFDSDIFETRLLLSKTVCIMGEEAATEFYREGRLTRRGAIPPTTLMLLQDKHSVATLDDEAHKVRKAMFMSLMTPDAINRLVVLFERRWRQAMSRWEILHEVDLFDEVETVICRAVCEWCGILLDEHEAPARTREIAAMIDGAGAIGLRNWRGALLRTRTEHWLRTLIEQVRAGKSGADPDSTLAKFALHKDAAGNLLDTKVAAIEVLNVLRPTVAVARYVLFAAIAMHKHPACREKLLSGDEEYLFNFVQEVRRFYPFFPFVGGLVRSSFTWRGYHFSPGTRVMLDVYGTCHDPRLWEDPYVFRPERFHNREPNSFMLIPQGGGDFYSNHRCAGEWITIELMKRAVRLLVHEMTYEVVPRDYTINLKRMPALPMDRFLIRNVRRNPTTRPDPEVQSYMAV